MNLHEYQTKQLLGEYGIPVPPGAVAATAATARHAAEGLGGSGWVVKAQVHAGGRGAAGGVRLVNRLADVEKAAAGMLGKHLVTGQTGAAGLPVNHVLVESTCDVHQELYLGVAIDRGRQRIVLMASASGGIEIEELAAAHPERILTVSVDPVMGLQPYQTRRMFYHLGVEPGLLTAYTLLVRDVFRLFVDKDLSLLEINPLVVTRQGGLLALDAKLVVDDNALYRQPDLSNARDWLQEDEKERRAHQYGLNYITLDGDIACMVNGAGLAMATMDLIKLHGGEPANFLDVGGGTTAERVAEAFKLILSDTRVKAVLINIFGGIVRCDLIAEGIITAVKGTGARLPVVVRLEGTNAALGRQLLDQSGLTVMTATDLTDAAQKAVAAARGPA